MAVTGDQETPLTTNHDSKRGVWTKETQNELEIIVDMSWVHLQDTSLVWQSIIEKECPNVDIELLLDCVSDNIEYVGGEEEINWHGALIDYQKVCTTGPSEPSGSTQLGTLTKE